MLQGLGTGIIFPPPTTKPVCTSQRRVEKGECKIQKGVRRDGTELSLEFYQVIKRIRRESSKRTQGTERKEKICCGVHSQEYPTQTQGIFPSTPQGLPRPFWEMTVRQQTKKSLEQQRNKRQRDRTQEVPQKSAE